MPKDPPKLSKEYKSSNLVGAISGDRYNMGEAIASQPTAEMRADLEKLGVALPEGDEFLELSQRFNAWLEQHRHDQGLSPSTTWFNLFAEVDQDGSGYITFDEMTNVVRQTLRKDTRLLSENLLKGLWCALDADDSNAIQKDEMASFFKLGAIPKKPPPLKASKEYSSSNLVGAISGDRYNMSAAIASQPTTEMRAELEQQGYPLPDQDEILEISQRFNSWLEQHRYDQGLGYSTTWFNLFAEVDLDGSGYITFDELTNVVRQSLRKGPKVMSEKALKALWCSLDVDASDAIQKDEMAGFFKLGAIEKVKPKLVAKEYSSSNLVGAISGDRYNMNVAIASQPTAEMRAELESAGHKLPSESELVELSKKFNAWLEQHRHDQGLGHSTTWFNLFAEVDQDGSGYITFDELTNIVRQTLKKPAKVMSEKAIKALWCSLDLDDSNAVQKDEMASFFKLGAPAKHKADPANAKKSSQNLVDSTSRYGMNVALACQPTKEMRAELDKEGFPLPSADELTDTSKNFNVWLNDYRESKNLERSVTWFNLFAEVDRDGSGYITFDELTTIVRQTLRKGFKVMSSRALKALWCSLDADDSDAVQKDEMALFFKMGAPAVTKKPPKNLTKEYKTSNLVGLISGDRVNMNVALDSQPTADMRAELDAAGIAVPAGEKLVELSKKFNGWLEQHRHDQGLQHSVTWFNLFATVDRDGSGYITFDELKTIVRQTLRKGPKVMSEKAIKALWCGLDVDDSNAVQKDEMAAFFKLGAPAKHKADPKNAKKSSQNLVDSTSRYGMMEAIASQPTADMRIELEKAGVAIPNDEELTSLSKRFSGWLEARRHLEGKAASTTWYNLFAEVDQDGSGFITYDEMRRVVRQKLRVKAAEFSDRALKSLWVALDVDDSNQIMKDEYAAFTNRSRAKSRLVRKSESQLLVRPSSSPQRDRALAEQQRKKEEEKAAMKVLKDEMAMKLRQELVARQRELTRAREVARRQAQRKMEKAHAVSQYKRELLHQMKSYVLASPIPLSNGDRIGGTRILPLYQSERLLLSMEQNGAQQPWPHSKPMAPRTTTTMFTDELSRLDANLMAPAWAAKLERSPSSRQSLSRVPSRPSTGGMATRVPPGMEPVKAPAKRATTPVARLRGSASMPVL